MLNRTFGDRVCNGNSSIHQLYIFNFGELKKVPNCSFFSNFTFRHWSDSELSLLLNVQTIEEFESPIILTIDLDSPNKVESVADYYWVGSQYFDFDKLRPLNDWIFLESLGGHSSAQSFYKRVLTKFKFLLRKNRESVYSWAKNEYFTPMHLVEVLMNEREYCKEVLFDLKLKTFCQEIFKSPENLESGDPVIFLPAMEYLIAQILRDYFILAFSVVEREKLINHFNFVENSEFGDLDSIYKSDKSYSDLVLHLSNVVADLVKILHPKQNIRQQALAQVLNERLLFSENDLLVVNTGTLTLPVHSLYRDSSKSFKNSLWINKEGIIYNSYSRLTNMKMGELFFINALAVGSELNLRQPAFQRSKFIYLTREDPDFKKLLKQGVESYFHYGDEIQYAKLHRDSLILANISTLNLEGLEDLGEPLGWQGSKEILNRSVLLPLANIEGVLSYRLNLPQSTR